jgi:hypothetical protein
MSSVAKEIAAGVRISFEENKKPVRKPAGFRTGFENNPTIAVSNSILRTCIATCGILSLFSASN